MDKVINETEFIIVADYIKDPNHKDYEHYKECLVYTCGKDRSKAEEVLDRILNNPDERDLQEISEGAHNFKIKEVVSRDCWWNDPFLAN